MSRLTKGTAKRARIYAIIGSTVTDDKNAWRMRLHVMQLVYRTPQRKDGPLTPHDGLAVKCHLNTQNYKCGSPNSLAQARQYFQYGTT